MMEIAELATIGGVLVTMLALLVGIGVAYGKLSAQVGNLAEGQREIRADLREIRTDLRRIDDRSVYHRHGPDGAPDFPMMAPPD